MQYNFDERIERENTSCYKYDLREKVFGTEEVIPMEKVVALITTLSNIELIGIHFHIGSQITDMCPFQNLCVRVNEIQDFFEQKGIKLAHEIDYRNLHPLAAVADYVR